MSLGCRSDSRFASSKGQRSSPLLRKSKGRLSSRSTRKRREPLSPQTTFDPQKPVKWTSGKIFTVKILNLTDKPSSCNVRLTDNAGNASAWKRFDNVPGHQEKDE